MNARRKFNLDPDSPEVATVEDIEPMDDDMSDLEYLSLAAAVADESCDSLMHEMMGGFEELNFEADK
jgi:hypothetical protein